MPQLGVAVLVRQKGHNVWVHLVGSTSEHGRVHTHTYACRQVHLGDHELIHVEELREPLRGEVLGLGLG